MRRAVLAVVLAAVALAGCEDGDEVQTPVDTVQPESRDEGIQATGQLDGARVAISRANPTVIVGDCDANDGFDDDLCILARTIDGVSINLVVENPDVLVAGETVDAGVRCSTGCDEVTDGAVVELRVDGEPTPVVRGRLDVEEAGPRWIARFELFLVDGGRLSGTFDVAPTPIG